MFTVTGMSHIDHACVISWESLVEKCYWELSGCDGRVVKAMDLKSIGIFPRRFEPYSQRVPFNFSHNFIVGDSIWSWVAVQYRHQFWKKNTNK